MRFADKVLPVVDRDWVAFSTVYQYSHLWTLGIHECCCTEDLQPPPNQTCVSLSLSLESAAGSRSISRVDVMPVPKRGITGDEQNKFDVEVTDACARKPAGARVGGETCEKHRYEYLSSLNHVRLFNALFWRLESVTVRTRANARTFNTLCRCRQELLPACYTSYLPDSCLWRVFSSRKDL